MGGGDRSVQSEERKEYLQAAGVKCVAFPASGKYSEERRARERTHTWKRGYRWRAGIEGRTARLRRDFGWHRNGYHRHNGMERCLGLRITASNLRSIPAARSPQPLITTKLPLSITVSVF